MAEQKNTVEATVRSSPKHGRLQADQIFEIYPGPPSYKMADKIQALSLSDLGKPGA